MGLQLAVAIEQEGQDLKRFALQPDPGAMLAEVARDGVVFEGPKNGLWGRIGLGTHRNGLV